MTRSNSADTLHWLRSHGWRPAGIVAVAWVALVPLAWLVAPWYDAYPVPVQLRFDAPADARIEIECAAPRPHRAPLVPVSGAGEPSATLWLGELPPLPEYRLRLLLGESRDPANAELVLLNPRDLGRPLSTVAADDLVPVAGAAGRWDVRDTVVSARYPRWRTSLKAWMVLVAGITVAGLFVVAALRGRPAPANTARLAPSDWWPLWLAFALGLAAHLAVTACLPAVISAYDPLVYFHKAVWLLEKGTYDTGVQVVAGTDDLDRLPGYPLFLAACFAVFGYDLRAATLFQGTVFGAALLSLAVSLGRWVPPRLSGAALVVALLSPQGLYATRTIGTESPFASIVAFAMAAFFVHIGARGVHSVFWLVIHGLAVTAAVFLRPNGIILLVAPLTAFVLLAVREIRAEPRAVAALVGMARGGLRYGIPCGMAAMCLLAWSLRNERCRGFRAPTAMVGVSRLEGLMQAGIFEPCCLADDGLREDYLRGKHALDYAFTAWDVRVLLEQRLEAGAGGVAGSPTAALDAGMQRLASCSWNATPWPLRLAGLLRVGTWATLIPVRITHARSPIHWSSGLVYNHPMAIAAWDRFAETHCRAWLGAPIVIRGMEDATARGWAVAAVGHAARLHHPCYLGLLVIAVVTGAGVAWRHSPLLALPVIVVLANITLNTLLLHMQGRYFFAIEYLLPFQAATALALLGRGRGEAASVVLLPASGRPPADAAERTAGRGLRRAG